MFKDYKDILSVITFFLLHNFTSSFVNVFKEKRSKVCILSKNLKTTDFMPGENLNEIMHTCKTLITVLGMEQALGFAKG